MSTRSAIGVMNSDDTILGVYCHWNGFLIGVGDTLRRYYSTEEKVRELLSYGNISSLCENIGTKHCFTNRPMRETTFYGRDREEKDQDAIIYSSTEDFMLKNDSLNYIYLYNPDIKEWIYKKNFEMDELVSVEEALKMEYNIHNTRIKEAA